MWHIFHLHFLAHKEAKPNTNTNTESSWIVHPHTHRTKINYKYHQVASHIYEDPRASSLLLRPRNLLQMETVQFSCINRLVSRINIIWPLTSLPLDSSNFTTIGYQFPHPHCVILNSMGAAFLVKFPRVMPLQLNKNQYSLDILPSNGP